MYSLISELGTLTDVKTYLLPQTTELLFQVAVIFSRVVMGRCFSKIAETMLQIIHRIEL